MQQRQLRLGDILDDYCPRERRVTNHAVVAMVGADVKQTRCTTCEAEHEYKHGKVPRQRRKTSAPAALAAPIVASGPKRIAHESPSESLAADQVSSLAREEDGDRDPPHYAAAASEESPAALESDDSDDESDEPGEDPERESGPVHRPLIRASLPRPEGQPPPTRPVPEFTIRQPGGRAGRFR